MKIWLKAKANFQISHFLIQILTFASSVNIKHLQIFSENEDYREFKEFFEKFEDFCKKNQLNDKKFEMRFGCFTIFKKIPASQIEKQNIIITTENIEFLNLIESISLKIGFVIIKLNFLYFLKKFLNFLVFLDF